MAKFSWLPNPQRQQAVDLGSSALRVSQPPHESVLSEPSVIVRNEKTGSIVAIGNGAEDLRGRTPDHYTFIEPIQNSVVADPDAAITLLSRVMHRYRSWYESIVGQQFVIGVPPEVTDTNIRSLADVFERVGSRSSKVVPNPVAALIGVDVAVDDPFAQMVIDIGSDTTEIGIVAQKNVIATDSLTVAGGTIDEAIQSYMETERNLRISKRQAQRMKHQLAAVNNGTPPEKSLTVYGQDTASRLPRETSVSADDISKAIQPTVDQLTSFVQTFLQSVSSDIAADVYTHGVHFIGGSARLPGLADELAEVLSISVYEHEQPEDVIVRGLGRIADQKQQYAQDITDFTAYASTS